MTTLALSGLGIIVLSWLLELLGVWEHGSSLNHTFILTYGIGTALLLIDSAGSGLSTEGWMHVITLLVVALVYIRVHRTGKGH